MKVSTKPEVVLPNNEGFFHRVCRAVVSLVLLAVACGTSSLPRMFGDPRSDPVPDAVQSKAIPAGYFLPVKLEHTLSAKDVRAGDVITARTMQEIPLPNKERIAFRSVVHGSVLNVTRDEDETGLELTLRFDAVTDHGLNLPIVTSLRAIASHMAVDEAQIPRAVYDEQTPLTWATTYQIGGDQRFGDGGAVRNHWNEKVGKAVRGGVLVQARANPQRGCGEQAAADEPPQALWLFSADACGVYGMKSVQLLRSGQSAPLGEITLHFKKADMRLGAGTGILLRVVSVP